MVKIVAFSETEIEGLSPEEIKKALQEKLAETPNPQADKTVASDDLLLTFVKNASKEVEDLEYLNKILEELQKIESPVSWSPIHMIILGLINMIGAINKDLKDINSFIDSLTNPNIDTFKKELGEIALYSLNNPNIVKH